MIEKIKLPQELIDKIGDEKIIFQIKASKNIIYKYQGNNNLMNIAIFGFIILSIIFGIIYSIIIGEIAWGLIYLLGIFILIVIGFSFDTPIKGKIFIGTENYIFSYNKNIFGDKIINSNKWSDFICDIELIKEIKLGSIILKLKNNVKIKDMTINNEYGDDFAVIYYYICGIKNEYEIGKICYERIFNSKF